MYAGEAGRPIDRTAMIEAASRSLRQQMVREANQRTRDRPRSKGSQGSLQATRSLSSMVANAARRGETEVNTASMLYSEEQPSNSSTAGNNGGGSTGAPLDGEPCTAENAQRRIRSAENEHRIIHAASREGPHVVSSPSSALDNYAADEEDEPQQAPGPHPGLEDVANLGDLKRPLSRKRTPLHLQQQVLVLLPAL